MKSAWEVDNQGGRIWRQQLEKFSATMNGNLESLLWESEDEL